MSYHKTNYCPITGNPCNMQRCINLWEFKENTEEEFNLCKRCGELYFFDKINKKSNNEPSPANMLNSLIEMLGTEDNPKDSAALEKLEDSSRQKEILIIAYIDEKRDQLEKSIKNERYEVAKKIENKLNKITKDYEEIIELNSKIEKSIEEKDFQKITNLKKQKINKIDLIYNDIK